MALKSKFQSKRENILRDVRPFGERFAETLRKSQNSSVIFLLAALAIVIEPKIAGFADLIFFILSLYFWWLYKTPLRLPFKLPKTADRKDLNNPKPGGGIGDSEGILYFGNDKENGEEIWFTNNDARTHILYLGTTGSGKTEGLKSISANSLCWASGFLYIDGKADTDLWSTISAMARRFGRDDDLLIMNYMTGNVGGRVPSNTMNPFSSGSAGYLVNMLVSLMPDAEGDNAMWKERAVALVSALMPCLVWKRENQNLPISVSVIRRYMGLGDIISLSRDPAVPVTLTAGLKAYLNELPGYVDEAFDDEGNEKPLPPDAPPFDSATPRQQHGYLSMQFTRSLQSLGDDYGFIFDTQAADIDMMDVVLQRRIMITLIPALEKSSDETANLGKIIASTLKGMMGATLGSTVEGASETAIENKPARSETPFIAIFDEVGYYAAQGMAVMAAQARSLGFCLVYAAQDLPAMEKRVKEEARSITANCNIKLFGKLEDPTQTKEFFEKTVGQSYVTEVSGFAKGGGASYADGGQASLQLRARADYDELRAFTEGRAICAFGPSVTEIQVYYSNPGFAKAMRVQRMLPVPPPSESVLKSLREVKSVLDRLRSKDWKPHEFQSDISDAPQIHALVNGMRMAADNDANPITQSALALATLGDDNGYINISDMEKVEDTPAPSTSPTDSATTTETPTTIPGTNTGPLSWMDVIGQDGSDTMTKSLQAKPQEGDDISWDDVMNSSGQAPKTDVTSQDAIFDKIFGDDVPDAPVDTIQTAPLTAPTSPTTEASESAPAAPLSWANIMGMPATETSDPTPVAPPPAVTEPATERPVSPVTTPVKTSSTTTEDPQAPVDQGLSWADIIGADAGTETNTTTDSDKP